MLRFISKLFLLWALLIGFVGLMNQSATATVNISPVLQPQPGDTNININLFVTSYVPSSPQPDDVLVGSILSITNDGENLNLSFSDWDVASAASILTNGIYQVVFPDDGSPARFWQVGQQP
jgi:hypothetical protein